MRKNTWERKKIVTLSVKLSQCIFDAHCMEFLGIIIGQGEVRMDEKKLEAIKEWKPPTSVKGVWLFTGFANFYKKFIPDFSNIVAPLNLLTRKAEPWAWTQLQQHAFEWLKHIFSSAPVLWIPDVTHPFSIMTDTSLLVTEAVLMQIDENSDLHPCTYFSHTFSSTQCNYDIYDQELLAIILALEEWCQYLQGTTHSITVITNHKNLSYIKDPWKLSRQQARWSLFLQDFDIQWQVTPGTKMAPADALSRCDHVNTTLDNQETSICPEPIIIQALDLALAWKIQSSTKSDPLVLQALESLKMGSPLFPHSSMNDWHMTNGHLYFKGRMYIPPHERQATTWSIHDFPTTGHAGHFHTKTLLERDFWWPGLSSFVNTFIAGCATCQQNKVNHHPTCPSLTPIPSSSPLPFKQLSVNLITDLPLSNGHDSLMVVVNHALQRG